MERGRTYELLLIHQRLAQLCSDSHVFNRLEANEMESKGVRFPEQFNLAKSFVFICSLVSGLGNEFTSTELSRFVALSCNSRIFRMKAAHFFQ